MSAIPVPMILFCPMCHERHVDAGEFATKPHHTHACQSCGFVWRPAVVPTVGVQFLPGYRDGAAKPAPVPGPYLPQSPRDVISQRVAERDRLLFRALDALSWCAGSPDFAEGGRGCEGWLQLVAPVLGALRDWKQGRLEVADSGPTEKEMLAENAALRKANENIADEWRKERAELVQARAELSAVATDQEHVWLWQGKGDHVESLVCPVVMAADTLRELLAQRGAENRELGRQEGFAMAREKAAQVVEEYFPEGVHFTTIRERLQYEPPAEDGK